MVCPLIEESEAVEARAATAEYDRLASEVFPDLRVDLLHGRMSSRQKEQVMSRFRDGGTDILVSTAVVEVGIDVPNATVMLVEAAHRFGGGPAAPVPGTCWQRPAQELLPSARRTSPLRTRINVSPPSSGYTTGSGWPRLTWR